MVEKPQDLNRGWPSPQSLIELIDELKEARYNIGVDQYIAAQELLLVLMAQGGKFDQPESLRSLLGPLLCSSPTEQEEFEYRFNRWAERIGLAIGAVRQTDAQAEKLDRELREVKQQQKRWLLLLLAFLIVLVLSFGIFQRWYSPPDIPPKPTPEPTQTIPSPTQETPPTTPTPDTQGVPVPSPDPALETCLKQPLWWSFLQDRQVQLALLFLLPLPLLLFWLWFWFWQANQFLVRRSTTQAPELERISIAGIDENLFPPRDLLRIAQGLRRRIQVPDSELDILKTVRETVRRVGWFTPLYGYRQVVPEYLVLIDRTSPDDHQARLIEVMLEQLVENGVFISRYFFKDDPRICFPVSRQGVPCQLQELVAKHRQHRLVIFSDTEGLLSSQTGELESWTAVFSAWSERAVLTPEPPQHWGEQERELAQQFTVLPLTLTGLVQFIHSLELGRSTYAPSGSAKVPLPSALRERPRRWLEEEAADSREVEVLLASLQRYLGQEGYYWFSACAVFPLLRWDLTLYLGESLLTENGQKLLTPERLSDMARLPWFRSAYMPDWLRIRLIAALSRQQEQKIRKALSELLFSVVQGQVSRWQLEIAREHKSVVSWLVAPLLSRLSRRGSRDSPLRDYIFRDFMAGLKPSKLAVRLPSGRAIIMPSVRLTRRRFLRLAGLASVGMGSGLLLHRWLRTRGYTVVTVDATGNITKCQQRRNEFRTVALGSDVSLELMRIPGGTFLMGTEDAEIERLVQKFNWEWFRNEKPQHEVTVQPFLMSKFLVTQAQYQQVMGENPSIFKGDERPVEQVSWDDAVEFCQRLSKQTGKEYRLPSEAEWEYAARAGTITPFHYGETITWELANYRARETFADEAPGEYRRETTPVGTFTPNAFGLYDLHGNVWEWCQDDWHDSYKNAPTDGSAWASKESIAKVIRGGSWDGTPVACRSASRDFSTRDYRGDIIGFRVVCVVPRTT